MMKNFTRLFIGAMLIISNSAQAQDGLFISEIIDPADDYTGRFIELFNAGAEAVDFSTTTLFLSRQSNGGTGWGDVQLAGTVAAGETFVIGGSGFEAVYGFPPDQLSGILIGNGDDAYFLYREGDHSAGLMHDIYGAIDTDGTGEPWEYEDSRALRMESIMAPSTTWNAGEWVISPAGFSDADPGTHYGSAGVDTLLSPDSISLTLINDTVSEGQSLEVSVSVSELSLADNVISYQFDIEYDNTVLDYTAVNITGTIAEGGTLAVNTGVTGKLSISYMNSSPLTGAGSILNLQFMSLAVDTTEIIISNAYLNNSPIQDLVNGTVIIKSAIPPTAEITYNDTNLRFADTLVITASFSENMDDAYSVQLSLNGAVTLADAEMVRQSERIYTYNYQIPKAEGEVTLRFSHGRDIWGNDLVSVPTLGEAFHIMKFTLGDVDDDGTILAYDAAITLQHSVALDPLPVIDPLPWENWRDSTANVDGIGSITAYDAGLILQYSAGIISSFPAEALKSILMADIKVNVTDNDIIFYSYGDLIGFNLSITNGNEILGIPSVPGEDFLFAFNNIESTYKIGLCTAFPPEDGTPILKIPFMNNGSVSFRMLVNLQELIITAHLATGLFEYGNPDISVYPNPMNEQATIRFSNPDHAEYRLIMRDFSGKIVRITGYVRQSELTIFRENLTPGYYLLEISGNQLFRGRLIVQ